MTTSNRIATRQDASLCTSRRRDRAWPRHVVILVFLSLLASCADDLTDSLTEEEVRQLGVAVAGMVVAASFVMLFADPLTEHEVECDNGTVEVVMGATTQEATLVPRSCSITTPPFGNPFTVTGDPSIVYAAPVVEPATARGAVSWIHADGRTGTCSLDLRFAGQISGEMCGRSVTFTLVDSASPASGASP